jgi:hypothetical protein
MPNQSGRSSLQTELMNALLPGLWLRSPCCTHSSLVPDLTLSQLCHCMAGQVDQAVLVPELTASTL